MTIEKTSEKYTLTQEGENYTLELGKIKRGENTTTELKISGIEDSNLFLLKVTCGCTTTEKTNIDKNTQIVKVAYTQCDPTISKVMEIRYNNTKIGIIKIKGLCK
jgi:hypothetical protein